MHRWVTGEPQLLLYRGEYIHTALRKARVTEDDVLAAIRAAGIAKRSEVHAVVLETDASLSVIETQPGSADGALEGLPTDAGSSDRRDASTAAGPHEQG